MSKITVILRSDAQFKLDVLKEMLGLSERDIIEKALEEYIYRQHIARRADNERAYDAVVARYETQHREKRVAARAEPMARIDEA